MGGAVKIVEVQYKPCLRCFYLQAAGTLSLIKRIAEFRLCCDFILVFRVTAKKETKAINDNLCGFRRGATRDLRFILRQCEASVTEEVIVEYSLC